jgi:hypothetical protein
MSGYRSSIFVTVFAAALCPTGHAQIGKLIGSATYQSYNPQSRQADLTEPLYYQLPDPAKFGPGPYPVFIWVPGTWELYIDPMSLLMVGQMAQRGFLSVSVQYSNTRLLAQSCLNYSERARSIFDATRSTSAVGAVCSLAQAGCGQGIVTSGISQGGAIAVLSANYAPQVQAVFAMSASDYLGISITNPLSAEIADRPGAEVERSGGRPGAGSSLASCLAKTNTAIPSNRLTIINGAEDPIFGSVAATQATSGISCDPGSTQCWSPDGSGAGWYLVTSSEKTTGTANHCYMDIGGCDDIFDPKWLPSSKSNWSLAPNLDWLATLGTKRVYSATGQ